MTTSIRCEVQIDYKSSGWTDVTDKINKVEINRSVDRRTGRTKAGVCTLRSVMPDPWVTPWPSAGVWDEVTLIGSPMRVMLTVFDTNSSTREIVYVGTVAEVGHETSELLHGITVTCLDLWGDKIAHAYLDAPAEPVGSSTRTRFNTLMDAAGFTVSTDYTGTGSQRKLDPEIEKPKQRLVDALQRILDSENGYLFVDRFNVLHFVGHPTSVATASLTVSDSGASGTATFVKTPQIVLDTERLVNAVIVVASNPVVEEEPYSRAWGTARMGSVKADTRPNPVMSIQWELLRRGAPSDYFALRSVRTDFTQSYYLYARPGGILGYGRPWSMPKGTRIQNARLATFTLSPRYTVVLDAMVYAVTGGQLLINAYTYDRQNGVGTIIQEDQLPGDPIYLLAPPEPVSYSVPWKSSGQGKGVSGATEAVRTDAASIALHGRYERRIRTGLGEDEIGLLADEILRERSELRPVIPDVDIAVNLEAVDVARKLLALELDSYLQIEFTPKGETATYSDLSPIVGIRYQILPLDMAKGLVRVSARYTLFRSTKPTYWILGVSKLGTDTVVGTSGTTDTPGDWVDNENVDVDGIARLTSRVVSRYATNADMTSAEGTPSSARYTIETTNNGFLRYDPNSKAWATIGTFK